MPDHELGTSALSKMSLRRALWRARMTAKALHDHTRFDEPERHATAFLRERVRESLQATPLDEIDGCPVYAVASGWQSDVLKQDPRVLCADNHRTLTGFLETPEPLEVLALRQSSLTVERLKALCPSGMRDKTLFLEV